MSRPKKTGYIEPPIINEKPIPNVEEVKSYRIRITSLNAVVTCPSCFKKQFVNQGVFNGNIERKCDRCKVMITYVFDILPPNTRITSL
jgi:hypothetical protein